MKCPTDGSVLVMSERSGIEIDYCPDCRGVWLDRGELDKIIDRAAPSGQEFAPQPQSRGSSRPTKQPNRRRKEEEEEKEGSWLAELFG